MSRSPWLQKLLQNLQTADRMLALAWFHAFRLMRAFWQNHGRPGFRSLSAMAVKTFAGLRRAVLDCGRTLSLVYQRCVTLLRIYWPPCRQRLVLYARLARLDRPIGAMLLLWPTLWALWIAAAGVPALHLLFVFVAGVLLTRSAGCVVNDYADRDFDPHVRRTRERPLATRQVSRREALLLALALVLMAFVLVLTTDPLTVKLSFIAIPLAVIYPFMKRYTYIPQLFLGLAFSWGIPMAFSAVSGHVPTLAWLVFIANILWVMVYDTLYAMVDREDDIRVGVKSTAILFGDMDRFFVGVFQVMTLTVLVIIGIQIGLDMYYYVFLFIAAVLMAYHQYLIRDRRPEMCFRAFLHNNWVGMAIFGGLWANYL